MRLTLTSLLAGVAITSALASAYSSELSQVCAANFEPRAALNALQWREDLRFLAAQLPQRHVNPFFATERATFDALVADLDRRIPTLTDNEVIVGLMQLVASLKDGHTTLPIPETFQTYPFRARWFQNALYITEATRGFEVLLGARLKRIGTVDIADAFARIASFTSWETPMDARVRTQRLFSFPDVLLTAGFGEPTNPISIELQLKGNATETRQLKPMEQQTADWVDAQASKPLYRQQQDTDSWFQLLRAEKIAYVKYNACRGVKLIARVTADMSSALERGDADRVVLDLRGNAGGNSEALAPLLDTLRDKLIVNKRNHLFVLIDRETFSSAVINAWQIRTMFPNATFVGEPTGGALNDFGEVLQFQLPNSGLSVWYSTARFEFRPGVEGSLEPDIHIETSIEDWLSGVDPVLRFVAKASLGVLDRIQLARSMPHITDVD